MDVLDKIYQALRADALILSKVEGRFKYYEYPETGDVTQPYIIIDPLAPPIPNEFGDNEWIAEEHLIQIDVWAKTRADKDLLGKRIREVMQGIGFVQSGSGVDEYDKDVNIFRDGRRYVGVTYK